MKVVLGVAVIIASILFGVPVVAAEPTDSSAMDEVQALAGARLRNQDRMFALMMAAYFEIEQDRIDENYDQRLKAWGSAAHNDAGFVIYAPSKLEQRVPSSLRAVALHERDLKMAHVARSMTDLIELYETARTEEQKSIGAKIPNAMDIQSATQQIKQFLRSRRPHSRDPRLWAERDDGTTRVALPILPKRAPLTEAAAQRPRNVQKTAKLPAAEPECSSMISAIIFGLPMLRTPFASRP